MSIIYVRLLPILIALSLLCFCVRADSPALTGFYCEDDLNHPLAGALIALYKADNNLLVDSTYSRNDGAFTLKSPSTKGKYYVIATKDQVSHKMDIDYDPQTSAQNLLIQHHQPKSAVRIAISYLVDQFSGAINILIGLFIGLGFNKAVERRKARQTITREIKGIQDAADDLDQKYEELRQTAEDYGKSSADASAKRAHFTSLAALIDAQVGEFQKQLEAKTELQEAIYAVHKLRGRNNFATTRRALRDIKKLTEAIAADPLEFLDDSSQRNKRLEPFRTLKTAINSISMT